MERVVVTGIGLISPVGIGTSSTWEALIEGKNGIGPISLFDSSEFRVHFAGEVKNWDPLLYMERKKFREMDRFATFAFAASQMAIADAQLQLTPEEEETTGCFIASGIGGLSTLEYVKTIILEKGPSKVNPYATIAFITNLAAGHVSIQYNLQGPSYCLASACSSGAHALGEAASWIERGLASVMIAGGAEAAITPVGIGGFEAMRALSRRNEAPEQASRPFDRDRDGFVCSEGAAILVLESLERAKKRGASIYAELKGYGATSDAYHLTQPAPEGRGAARSMRMALRRASVNPQEVDYINAHGTSTPTGDIAESAAIIHCFGEHALQKNLWISSTKSMTGHLLGAAGALESAVCALAIKHGRIPPTINLDNLDVHCPLEFVPHHARERKIRYALNNSFGFGGTNCSLLFSNPDL